MHNTLISIDTLVYGQIEKIAAKKSPKTMSPYLPALLPEDARAQANRIAAERAALKEKTFFGRLGKKTTVMRETFKNTPKKALVKKLAIGAAKNPYVRAAGLLGAAAGAGYGGAKLSKSASDLAYYFED